MVRPTRAAWCYLIVAAALGCSSTPLAPGGDPGPGPSPTFPVPTGTHSLQRLTLQSAALGYAKDIYLYLPPGYGQQGARRYPVIYMQDGNKLFAALNAYWVNWQLEVALTPLILAGRAAPVIVVGIGVNEALRIKEYTPYVSATATIPTGDGAAYARFVVEELKPYIDANYRTLPDRAHTAIGGSSLGGGMASWIAATYPSVLGEVAALSAAVRADSAVFEKAVQRGLHTRLYWSRGTLDGEAFNLQRDSTFRTEILALGWVEGRDFRYDVAIGDTHTEAAWGRRVGPLFLFLFPAGG